MSLTPAAVFDDLLPEPPRIVPEGALPTRENLALVLDDVAKRHLAGRTLTKNTLAAADYHAGAALTRHFGEPWEAGWSASWIVAVVVRPFHEDDDWRFEMYQRYRSPGEQIAALDVRYEARRRGSRLEPVAVVGVEVRAPGGRTWTFGAGETERTR